MRIVIIIMLLITLLTSTATAKLSRLNNDCYEIHWCRYIDADGNQSIDETGEYEWDGEHAIIQMGILTMRLPDKNYDYHTKWQASFEDKHNGLGFTSSNPIVVLKVPPHKNSWKEGILTKGDNNWIFFDMADDMGDDRWLIDMHTQICFAEYGYGIEFLVKYSEKKYFSFKLTSEEMSELREMIEHFTPIR